MNGNKICFTDYRTLIYATQPLHNTLLRLSNQIYFGNNDITCTSETINSNFKRKRKFKRLTDAEKQKKTTLVDRLIRILHRHGSKIYFRNKEVKCTPETRG